MKLLIPQSMDLVNHKELGRHIGRHLKKIDYYAVDSLTCVVYQKTGRNHHLFTCHMVVHFVSSPSAAPSAPLHGMYQRNTGSISYSFYYTRRTDLVASIRF